MINPARETKVLALSFISLAVLFSFFEDRMSAFCSKCLSLTGEITMSGFFLSEFVDSAAGAASAVAQKTPQPPVKKEDPQKPVTLKLPFTETPQLKLKRDSSIEAELKGLPLFPELRLFSGESWDKEKTEIRAFTDAENLYLRIYCSDANPGDLVKEFSLTGGAQNAWMDDSIELFLMKNSTAEYYYQHMASASGEYHTYYFKTQTDDPRMGLRAEIPKDFKELSCTIEETDDGYYINWTIPLSNIDIAETEISDGFHMQIVRNYRGQKKIPEAVTLQLFPVYIYGDSRFGNCNHHQRAFRPVEIIQD